MADANGSYDGLYRAHEWSRKQLQPFREQRLRELRQVAGKHYGENSTADRVPINLLGLTLRIYLRLLVSRNPRAFVTTRYQQLRSLADDMQQWEDGQIVEMHLARVLRAWVWDAFFGFGILKIGEELGGEFDWQGETVALADTFCDRVDPEDWVQDMAANSFEQCDFHGFRYRMGLDAAKQNDRFDKDLRSKLQPSRWQPHNEGGDEKLQTLSRDVSQSPYEEYKPSVELWELHLRRERKVLTCVASEDGRISGKPLKEVDYEGPAEGAFVRLSFLDVPNNSVPQSLAAEFIDMHELLNSVMLKTGRDEDQKKTVYICGGGNDGDAKKLTEARNRQAIAVNNPAAVQEFKTSGATQESLQFLLQMRNLYAWLAGNLDTLGGLAPQASTLGQEELLQTNSSQQIRDMQDTVVDGVRDVLRRLSWFWWHDRLRTHESVKKVEGVSYTTTARITPQQREGNWLKVNFDVNPYSLRSRTPAETSGQIKQLLTQLLLPAMPFLQQQGVGVDWAKLLTLLGKYDDMPELDEILTFAEPPPEESPQGEGPAKPSQTTRRYERVSRSAGPTPRGEMNQFAMGAPKSRDKQAVGAA